MVAEGVEDAGTYEALRRLGCDVVQGYHIARPVPAAEVTAAIVAWNGAAEPAGVPS